MAKNKYKVIAWGSVVTGEIYRYGIQIQLDGRGPWMHCYEDGPLFFATKDEAKAKVAEFKAEDKTK